MSSVEKIVERPVEDITRLEIRVGLVVKVWPHPEAERLVEYFGQLESQNDVVSNFHVVLFVDVVNPISKLTIIIL